MKIRFKSYGETSWHYSLGDFFKNFVKYTDPAGTGCQRRGIEDQADHTAELVGNVLETLLIRGVINVDDIDRILGSYYAKVEVVDED